MSALFDIGADGRVEATEHARGPWDPSACHGGPVAALLVRAVEQCEPGGVEWHVARVTVELTRPVPVRRPLTLETVLERPGRRVSLVGAVLTDGETEVARARGLRIRRADLPLPAGTVVPDARFPADPDAGTLEAPSFGGHSPAGTGSGADPALDVTFAGTACEHRFATGGWTVPGPVDVWIRLLVPVVHGETPTGAQRAAAAADFGNGVSSALDWERHLFINPDLTVHLLRPPAGEWIGLRAASHLTGLGVGMAESALHDEHGQVGRSVQSLYLDRR